MAEFRFRLVQLAETPVQFPVILDREIATLCPQPTHVSLHLVAAKFRSGHQRVELMNTYVQLTEKLSPMSPDKVCSPRALLW